MYTTHAILQAFGLTLLAGLATGIGSALAFFTKKTSKSFLSGALGFSAGVMIYISLIEIFPQAKTIIGGVTGEKTAYFCTTAAFFGGMAIIALIDKLVPSYENPHEPKDIEEMSENFHKAKLMRMGIMSALAIAIHNFPEGMATFTAALRDPTLGMGIAVAISIHNIPEGIAVSVPLFYATGSRKKSFGLSFLSGLAEPLGALLGFALLFKFMNDIVFGITFAAVAGIMVFISLDELLPTAEKYGKHHIAMYGVISGMIVMAISLLLFT